MESKTFTLAGGGTKTGFLVKWKGLIENTWETADQIQSQFPDQVAAFRGRRALRATEEKAEQRMATKNTRELQKATEVAIATGAREEMISQMTVDNFKKSIVDTLDEACGYPVWPGTVITVFIMCCDRYKW